MSDRTVLLTGNSGETTFGYAQGVGIDGVVSISGQVGRDNPTGVLTGERTLHDRAGQALRNVRGVAAGLAGPDAAVAYLQVHIGVGLEEHWDELAAELRGSYGDELPALTIVPSYPSSPEYLVEISAMATDQPRTTIPDDGPVGAAFATSRAVRVGDQVFLSGHLPTDADGAVVGATVAEQLERVCSNIADTLGELGLGLEALVSTHTWVAKPPTAEEWSDFSGAHRRAFGEGKPTATLIYVPELPLGAMVQISAVAAVQVV
jgi:enamine deaminase RidA (YjgF/YER057c/UK114 family)